MVWYLEDRPRFENSPEVGRELDWRVVGREAGLSILSWSSRILTFSCIIDRISNRS